MSISIDEGRNWAFIAALVIVLMFFLGKIFVSGLPRAYAMETTPASAPLSKERAAGGFPSALSTSSPVRADPCLPLIRTVRQTPQSVLDRTRRPAGTSQAAALSYIFGVRFALGPKEALSVGPPLTGASARYASDESGEKHALAIAAFRRCKNEQALKNLQTSGGW